MNKKTEEKRRANVYKYGIEKYAVRAYRPKYRAAGLAKLKALYPDAPLGKPKGIEAEPPALKKFREKTNKLRKEEDIPYRDAAKFVQTIDEKKKYWFVKRNEKGELRTQGWYIWYQMWVCTHGSPPCPNDGEWQTKSSYIHWNKEARPELEGEKNLRIEGFHHDWKAIGWQLIYHPGDENVVARDK